MNISLSCGRGYSALVVVVAASLCVVAVTAPQVAKAVAAASWPWLVLVGAGLLAGLAAGALGIGGALITVPTFYAVLPTLGVPTAWLPHAVVATALVAMVPTTLGAAHACAGSGFVDPMWMRRLAPWMTLGAVSGALLALCLPGVVLALAFAAQSIWNGARLARGSAACIGRARAGTTCPVPLAGSSIAGFCACVGMGGGSMVNPYLLAQGVVLHRAVATTSVLNLCIAFGGTLGFVAASVTGARGEPCWTAALVVGAMAFIAAPRGVAMARDLPEAKLRFFVGWANIVGAGLLVVQAIVVPAVTGAGQPPHAASASRSATSPPAAGVAPTRAAKIGQEDAAWPPLPANVLLVPWLDDSEPPAWAPRSEVTPCAQTLPVIVGDGPIRAGRPLPGTPFRLRLHLADCWPWGEAGPRLDGDLDLEIEPAANRLVVVLRPLDLAATSEHGSAPLRQRLAVVLSLDGDRR